MTAKVVDLAAVREQREEEQDADLLPWERDETYLMPQEVEDTEPTQYTVSDLREMMPAREWEVVSGWLEAGKSVAVWRRHVVWAWQYADRRFVSFVGEVPEHLSSLGTEENDRFRLVGVCRPDGSS